jgi:hypothetical protein
MKHFFISMHIHVKWEQQCEIYKVNFKIQSSMQISYVLYIYVQHIYAQKCINQVHRPSTNHLPAQLGLFFYHAPNVLLIIKVNNTLLHYRTFHTYFLLQMKIITVDYLSENILAPTTKLTV